MNQFRRNAPIIGALATLLLIGGLVGLSAPRPVHHNTGGALVSSATATVSPTYSPTAVSRQRVTSSNVLTDTPTPIPPTPTDTPVPPTATPSPSWHTLATYSGSTAQSLPSFTTSDPWRIDWTCTPAPTGQPTDGISIVNTVDGAGLSGFGDICGDTQPTSGTDNTCASPVQPGNACYGSHTYVATVQQNGSDPLAPWTVTIELWY